MPVFARKPSLRKSTDPEEPTWEDYQRRMSAPSTSQGTSLTRVSQRNILRSDNEEYGTRPTTRASVPNLRNPRGSLPQREGRDRFLSAPNTAASPSFDLNAKQPRAFHDVRTSPSLSQLNARARTHLQAAPRVSDAEADRIARACGDGLFSPSIPTTPLLEIDPYVAYPPHSRNRSQTINVASLRHTPPQAARDPQSVQPFPHPTKEQAVGALKYLLRKETSGWNVHDYLEIEDYMSGRMYEDEETLIVDFVRDKGLDDAGEDAMWRLQRKERRLMDSVTREIRKRDGSVFGAYLQDLADAAMAPVIVGGYKHYVPAVMGACIEELYKTGIYQPGLFRTLPNRARLLDLMARFDSPSPPSQSSPRSSVTQNNNSLAERWSLNQEATHDICALLLSYLNSLPVPLIHRTIVEALWAWCISPSVLRHEKRLRCREDDEASESSNSDSDYDEDTEDNGPSFSARQRERERMLRELPPLRTQVKIAQHVLLLLPRRQFSFIVHLFSFFATLQVCPDSGWSPEDIGRTFGAAVAGGRKNAAATTATSASKPEVSGRDKEARSQKLVAWIIKHWEQIASEYENEEPQEPERGRTRARSQSAASDTQPARRERSPTGRNERQNFPKNSTAGHQVTEEQRTRRQSLSQRGSASSCSTSATESDGDETRVMSPLSEPPSSSSAHKPRDSVRIRGNSDAAHLRHGYDSPPRVDLPTPLPHEKLFSVPAPFDIHESLEMDDAASVYSTDDSDIYSNSLLQEPLPGSEDNAQTLEFSRTKSSLATVLAEPPRSKQKSRTNVAADASAASRYVLERENAELKKRLEAALGERDEARKVVDAMRGLVSSEN